MIKIDRFLINPDHVTAIEGSDTDSYIYLTGGQTLTARNVTPNCVAEMITMYKTANGNTATNGNAADSAKVVAEATAKVIEKVADKPKADKVEKTGEKTDK